MEENKKYKIYHLSHPISKEIKYVGFTSTSLEKRLYDHLRFRETKDAHTYKSRWIRSLYKNGMVPVITLIDSFDNKEDALSKEIEMIKFYKEQGCVLTNSTSGGEGTLGYCPSDEVRYKIGNAMRGKKHTEESRKKMSKAGKGRKMSDEQKEKIRKANTGENSAWYGKKGENHPMFGKKLSEERRRQLSDMAKNRKMSEENRIKRSELMKTNNPFKGKNHSEEAKEKMRLAWEVRRNKNKAI